MTRRLEGYTLRVQPQEVLVGVPLDEFSGLLEFRLRDREP